MTQWLAQPSSTTKIWVCYQGRQKIYKLDNSHVVIFFVKTNDGRDRGLNFAIFAVWSVSYVLTESLKHEGSISSSSFYGQSAIIDTLLVLSTQWMNFPSRKWGCWVSLWFHLVAFVLGVNQENWGMGWVWQESPRFLATMVDSFSAALLTAIERYWTGSHLEFCQTSMTKLFSQSMWSTFRWWD